MCEVNLLFYKTNNVNKGLLAPFGHPLRGFSLRMSVGDILLVSSSAFLTHGVKLATSSKWDHVAMICFEPGKKKRVESLRLFEATMEGVELYDLEQALSVYKETSKMAVRRLMVVKTKEFHNRLDKFVSEVRGRPYKQDYWQLVRAVHQANEQDDLSSLFCSQLIAAAYQALGLIPRDIP
eukprot:CAMPEP_0201498448 /NCGR_PEP_ID=MMETSP0151_2-20130828/71151_1 /ASSEMBLY_ACC=CAM_ASM_000257 /TAXON_ID=200890 /ORGANISM="Paramoeba atlantica, Strain 621/1 / CCAP 1560/9" /LENGTH=179 /DNA_ID=CAMNT_0047890015 /DNA_START=25 /DNA_END=560 /DNA_ORIENTATION=+